MPSALYVAATVYVLQGSGLGKVEPADAVHNFRTLAYIQRAMREMADTWPAAAQTVESLEKLQREYCI